VESSSYLKVLGLIYSPNNLEGIDITPILALDWVGNSLLGTKSEDK
jgi:hypothetical protein